MNHELNSEEIERRERTAMLRKAELQRADGLCGTARLRNLSETGLGGVSDLELALNEDLAVTLDKIGTVKGHVAWVEGKSFGMAFDAVIDPEDLPHNKLEFVPAPSGYTVPERFKPVKGYKRPGFKRLG
jgi:PilZ domain